MVASLDESFKDFSSAHSLTVLDLIAPPSFKPLIVLDLHHSTWLSAPPYLTNYHFSFVFAILYESHTYREAHIGPLWQKAMFDELDALHKNHTRDMIDLPPNQSTINCKWVYKIKTKIDRSVERYKTHLVTKGFTQDYDINYEEKFILMAHITSVKFLIVVVINRVGLSIR